MTHKKDRSISNVITIITFFMAQAASGMSSLSNTCADDRILAANNYQLAAGTIFLVDKHFFF
jgi:hypothetical protein